MKKLYSALLVAFVILSSVYAFVLFIFQIKESDFAIPIEINGTALHIRNDSFGEGYFGAKRKGRRTHSGIDIETYIDSPVYASKSGFSLCKRLEGGYGNLIVIFHVDTSQTRYGHLSRFNVKDFQWVKQGQTIGFVGKSGNANYKSIKPHLHFEIRKGGKPVDPLIYLIGLHKTRSL